MKEFFRRSRKSFTPSQHKSDTQIPDNLWVKCFACRELIYQKQLVDSLKVCPKCGYHMRLKAREWVGLFDSNSFKEFDRNLTSNDPLDFVSPKDNYEQRLVESRELLELCDALISGQATIEGTPLQVTITEFDFIGGSMGSVFGEKLARAVERAVDNHTPLLTINASGGARQHEGIFSLMQMAKVNIALSRLSTAGLPHFSLLVDPCYAGVIASYASVADLILAEPGARIGFAGRRVIEQTIRQKLPNNYQTAEFFLERGMIDMIVARSDLHKTLTRLIALHMTPVDYKNIEENEHVRQNGTVVVKSAN